MRYTHGHVCIVGPQSIAVVRQDQPWYSRQFVEVEAASHNEAVGTATDLFDPDEAEIVDTSVYAMEVQTGESK